MRKELVQPLRFEPRWPVILAILALVLLLAMLPGRVRLFPAWLAGASGVGLMVPVAAVGLANEKRLWGQVEHIVVLLFVVAMGAGNLMNLTCLIRGIVGRSAEIPGMQLLSSSIAVWFINMLTFSLLYWQMDRGGPEARANKVDTRPDWLFPQTDVPEEAPPDWRPTFIDYVFLGFTTATAFSPTDALPLTSRAKMLMMLESGVSLVTIVVVAARAINVLGS